MDKTDRLALALTVGSFLAAALAITLGLAFLPASDPGEHASAWEEWFSALPFNSDCNQDASDGPDGYGSLEDPPLEGEWSQGR